MTELRAQEQDQLVERVCIEQNCGNPLPSSDLPEVCEPRISKVSFVHPRLKKVSLQNRISGWNKGLQNASPSELTSEESQTLSLKANDRPLPFSGISGDLVTIFRTRDRCVRSMIEADAEHPHCHDHRNWICNRFKDTVFRAGGNHWSDIEKNMDKRGLNGICVSGSIPDAKPKAEKPIRAVGLREEAMREKIKGFQKKGWIVPSQSHWVSLGFLVPKPGTNKWRLLIEYRYVNTQLRGCEFPLPVIEDLFVKQAGNQLWTLLDPEDGFHQMPLSECSRQYIAFCTPFGIFEWRVLPMGVKVGPQAFQRMVSDCLKSLQPHKHTFISMIYSRRHDPSFVVRAKYLMQRHTSKTTFKTWSDYLRS